ncbi:MAG: 2-dehydropantoate 2-reductase [Leptospiraceae bacterium]|nr:2-dehydropantoate 2-reductase [Leptospiraceae bacterium]MCP5496844.1 2-dehydropantoate 2-reductase [Leptospiraceae bacterium]
MEILIVGSGAIGGFYGGMLSLLPEVNIHFLCRSDYDVVAKEGIEIASPWKNFHFYPTGVLKQGMRSPVVFDYVVVTLKVLPNIFLAKVIGDYVNKKTSILLLQNGVGIEQGVVQAFPENEILSGLAFTCIHRTAPGKIKHLDYGHLSIGSFSKEQSKTASQLSELFNKAGVKCEVAKDIVSARWKKLVWNAPFNPISVLSGGRDTTAILQNKKTLQLVQNVMQEVCHLAELDGHRLADDVASKMIEMTLSMEPYKTSMLLDYESHREMEVEAILGNPLKIAKQHNAKLPYMETLYALLSIMNHES